MKGRVIVLSARPIQAALVVDGRVEDLLLSDPGLQPGDVRASTLTRKLPNDGGAFVDLGDGASGFLRNAKGLRSGDTVSVMVTSIAEPGKAYPVSDRILLKGRTLILTPGAQGVNVSRQIRDPEERERLISAVSAVPEGTGVIVRTAAQGVDAAILSAECHHLEAQIPGRDPAPQADRKQHALKPLFTALRDWSTPVPDLIAAPAELEDELNWESEPATFCFDPDLADSLRIGEGDPFDHFGVWEEIDRLKSVRADLPSGGWFAIEATRAMVTVDVNTADGFASGDAMSANIETARELPRQLRLRGLGGQAIIDFAPLKKMHRKKIDEELKRAFRKDPVETTLAGWTPLGNYELQRKRERRSIEDLL